MEKKTASKAESILRLSATVLSALSSALVWSDAETKTILFVHKRASSRDLLILWVFTITASVAAGYHLLQICRRFLFEFLHKDRIRGSSKFWAWFWLLLDQGVAYAMFAITVAATQGSMVAVTGVRQLQWSKICNIYSKFCHQIAGGLLCGIAASVVMAVVAAISARGVFRLYPAYPKSKPRWNMFYSNLS